MVIESSLGKKSTLKVILDVLEFLLDILTSGPRAAQNPGHNVGEDYLI